MSIGIREFADIFYNVNIIIFKGHQSGTHFQLYNKRQVLGGIKCKPIMKKK